MTIHFALVADRPAFFDSELHGDAIPADAVEITPARHAELLDAQAEGKELYADEDGIPRYRRREIPAAELRAGLIATVKREAARRIELVSPLWRQMNDIRGDMADPEAAQRFADIDAIRAASNIIEQVIADTPAEDLVPFPIADRPEWPALPSTDVA